MLFSLDVQGQSRDHLEAADGPIRPLSLGDTVPDALWDAELDVYHFDGRKEKLPMRQLRGKAILIDFWSTWCSGCIASIPKLTALYEENSAVNVLFVTGEGQAELDRFFGRSTAMDYSSFASVIQDTLLSVYFPHRSLPHVVWIDSDAILRKTSISHYVDEANLRKLLNGESLGHIPSKEEIHFDTDSRLLRTDDRLYSGVRSGLPSVRSATGRVKVGDTGLEREFYINYPALLMYKIAYGLLSDLPQSHIDIQVESFKKHYIPREPIDRYEWRRGNVFCYEAVFEEHKPSENLYAQMIRDLDTFFNIRTALAVRPTPCIVISSFPDVHAVRTDRTPHSIKGLIRRLNDNASHVIFIDETGQDGYTAVPDIDTHTVDRALCQLQDNGIEAVLAIRDIKIFQIKEGGDHQ